MTNDEQAIAVADKVRRNLMVLLKPERGIDESQADYKKRRAAGNARAKQRTTMFWSARRGTYCKSNIVSNGKLIHRASVA